MPFGIQKHQQNTTSKRLTAILVAQIFFTLTIEQHTQQPHRNSVQA